VVECVEGSSFLSSSSWPPLVRAEAAAAVTAALRRAKLTGSPVGGGMKGMGFATHNRGLLLLLLLSRWRETLPVPSYGTNDRTGTASVPARDGGRRASVSVSRGTRIKTNPQWKHSFAVTVTVSPLVSNVVSSVAWVYYVNHRFHLWLLLQRLRVAIVSSQRRPHARLAEVPLYLLYLSESVVPVVTVRVVRGGVVPHNAGRRRVRPSPLGGQESPPALLLYGTRGSELYPPP
jgi:hypothetical protein